MSTTILSTQLAAEPPPGQDYGYARISTRHQHEDRQIIALLEQGIPRRNIFTDKVTGGTFERKEYEKVLCKLKPGDCFFVKELDRFGRNYAEILENWRLITKEIGADAVVLDYPLLDTRVKNHDLTGRLICDLLLSLLSYLAEMEKRMNHQRQAEGIAVAKAKGIRFGRPERTKPDAFHIIYETWANGNLSIRAAAQTLGVAQGTFKMWALAQTELSTSNQCTKN